MDSLEDLRQVVLGNTLVEWALALGIVTAAMLLLAGVLWLVIHRLAPRAERSQTRVDDAVVAMLRRTRLWLLFFPALLLGTRVLELPERGVDALGFVTTIALCLQMGLWIDALVGGWIAASRERAVASNAAAATSLGALNLIARILLWSIVLLVALDNLGVDVTALVAGLGVGGIAVALAVQNILGDLFASLSIIVDKPFVVGDFIIVDSYMGTVEHVGLKTTRLRSLSGEQLVFSNSDLLASRVRNYKRMHERRVLFKFGVLYQTTPEQLEAIPGIVREAVESCAKTRFERAHFHLFGESSYDFEVVYWMLEPEYALYMDAQQAINLHMVRAFADAGIDFAYPTRTLFVENPLRIESGSSSGSGGGGGGGGGGGNADAREGHAA